MSISAKIFVTVMIGFVTVMYSHFANKKFDDLRKVEPALILQRLPMVSFEKMNGDKVDSKKLLEETDKGLVIHFWATWCAPCKPEIPELLSFAKKFENKGVLFALVATSDKVPEMKKFLKRFQSSMPKNVIILRDDDSSSLTKFGTVKVPETYLFDKSGNSKSKFIGAQSWDLTGFVTRFDTLLKLSE